MVDISRNVGQHKRKAKERVRSLPCVGKVWEQIHRPCAVGLLSFGGALDVAWPFIWADSLLFACGAFCFVAMHLILKAKLLLVLGLRRTHTNLKIANLPASQTELKPKALGAPRTNFRRSVGKSALSTRAPQTREKVCNSFSACDNSPARPWFITARSMKNCILRAHSSANTCALAPPNTRCKKNQVQCIVAATLLCHLGLAESLVATHSVAPVPQRML